MRGASYQLRVAIYCTSYELLFTCELRVTVSNTSYEFFFKFILRVVTYCTSYELIFVYLLQVTIYYTSYELVFTYELRVTIYCASCDCNAGCVKFLCYISYLFLTCSLQNQVFLGSYSWTTYFMNECHKVKL